MMGDIQDLDQDDCPKTPPLQPIHHLAEPERKCEVTEKLLQDDIWGLISVTKMTLQFIDTPVFQRLRNLHQLGGAKWVYPSATHTRFEHSIGTSHLASQWMTILRKQHGNDYEITQRDVDCVTIAGLVHDLGHGPFSHLFDGSFIPKVKPGSSWKHEDASVMMFDYLLETSNIDFSKGDANFVKALVTGEPVNCSMEDAERRYLFDIVANKRNSVDVDKFDYLARDSQHVGFHTDFLPDRIMKLSRIINGEICFSEKEAFNLYEMFHTRFRLHKKVYTHRVCKAVDLMISEALIAADPVLQLSNSIFNPAEYLYTNDHILTVIERSKDPMLQESQTILSKLHSRQLYKMTDEMVLTPEMTPHLTKDDITPEIICSYSSGKITPADIIVDPVVHNYSMKDSNPVDSCKFYSRWDETHAAPLHRQQVSGLLPQRFQDTTIRIYTRDPNPEKMLDAQRAFREYCEKRLPAEIHSLAFQPGLTIPNADTIKNRKGPMPRTPSADANALKRRLNLNDESSSAVKRRLPFIAEEQA